MIEHGELSKWLNYSPETGLFTWIKSPARNVFSGAVAGGKNSRGYLRVNLLKRFYFLHRLAWFYVYGVWPKGLVDHINGIKSDNSIKNLRECTQSQNMCNRGKTITNSSGFKNISWNKTDSRWKVQIQKNYIGYFKCIDDAVSARDDFYKKQTNQFYRV